MSWRELLEELLDAIQRGVERGLIRCNIKFDDLGWMGAAVEACVRDEIERCLESLADLKGGAQG